MTGRCSVGVTLIEILVILVVLALMVGAVSRVMQSSWQSQAAISGQNLVQKLAQQATDIVLDSLRGGSEVVSGDASHVTVGFANGDTTAYFLQESALKRNVFKAASGETHTETVVPKGIAEVNFSYYHRSGSTWSPAPTAAVAQLLRVSITTSQDKDRAVETSSVKLRNKTPPGG